MNLSRSQWLCVIVLDVCLRAASFFIPLYMIFTLPLSAVHLSLLISISAYVRTFELPARTAMIRTLVATNILFTCFFVLIWLWHIKTGHQTACVGANDQCDWIGGAITWQGVRTITIYTALQIVINLVSPLVTWTPSAHRSAR